MRIRHEEGFQFLVRFDYGRAPDIHTDEPPPLGSGEAPSPTALLAAAMGTCLASSLLFCLQKAHLEVRDLEVEVEMTTGRNAEGRLRIQHGVATLSPLVTDQTRAQMDHCLGLFQSFCTVTESVRQGIPMEISVVPRLVESGETVPPRGTASG